MPLLYNKTVEKDALILDDYLSRGGKLVIGARAGYKDEFGRCPIMKSPGLIENMCGCYVNDFSLLTSESEDVECLWDNNRYSMPMFNDVLCPESDSAKIIASYKNNYYKNQPAIILNKYRNGEVLSVGAGFSVSLAEKILEYFNVKAPYKNIITTPQCCEISVREGKNAKYIFVLNYSENAVDIKINNQLFNMLTEATEEGVILLEGYGVCVYKKLK